MKKIAGLLFLVLIFPACAGLSRQWSVGCAQSFGTDWVVVQYDYAGKPFNCWKLHNASVANEAASDGLQWKDPDTGHLVHISGWYNRVQVTGGNYDTAGKLLGVDLSKCGCGKYPAQP